jgi:hypothetical protein
MESFVSLSRGRRRTVRGRRRPRSWRLRGRKAQVSAIATILGLLLLVTYIANYIATTLPQQMTINDVNHDLEVQNEVGRLGSLLEDGSANGKLGAELTQPVVLGSEGVPPFEGPDSGQVGPASTGSKEIVTIGLSGGLLTEQTYRSSVVVELKNSQVPTTEIAYDYGSVVFAQEGGYPSFINAPPVSLVGTSLTIWIPVFSDQIGVEAGQGTAILAFELSSYTSETFPAGQTKLATAGFATITTTTPFAEAWSVYDTSIVHALTALGATTASVSCTGSSSVCSSTFIVGGSLGTVTMKLPLGTASPDVTSVTLDIATYSAALS